jgi:hypothetical protein
MLKRKGTQTVTEGILEKVAIRRRLYKVAFVREVEWL